MAPLVGFIFYILNAILGLLVFALIANAILSWLVAFDVINLRNQFVYGVARFLDAVTRPILAPFQKVIPSLGGVDISPVLAILVIYVTMVYGPIAAWLVELFPTRIRYTSMSLPYHIGNGWFGGFLPTIAFALVAATGNIYYGLWYPIGIALMTVVIGILFLRETKDVDITQ